MGQGSAKVVSECHGTLTSVNSTDLNHNYTKHDLLVLDPALTNNYTQHDF